MSGGFQSLNNGVLYNERCDKHEWVLKTFHIKNCNREGDFLS